MHNKEHAEQKVLDIKIESFDRFFSLVHIYDSFLKNEQVSHGLQAVVVFSFHSSSI